MARWCSHITACINLCALIAGLCILTVGIFMRISPLSSCHTLIVMPSVRIGCIIVIVSLLGLLGSCCRSPFLLWVYLFMYFMIIIVLAVGAVLWTIVIIKGNVKLEKGKEYRFNEFAPWFKDAVFGMTHFPDIRQCMIDRSLCSANKNYKNPFYSVKTLQEACCFLPPWCANDPKNSTIPGCDSWSTQMDKRCYYCDSCIGGFLLQISELWERMFPGYVALLISVIVVFVCGCQAFRQHKADHHSKVCYTGRA